MRLPFAARILLGCCIFAMSAATAARVQTTRGLVRVYDPRRPNPPGSLLRADSLLLHGAVLPAARRKWSKDAEMREFLDDCGEGFQVWDGAEGSFTRPGARQRAYLYSYCFVSRVMGGVGGIAVIEDGRVVAHVPFESTSYGLDAVPDLNGDGRSEMMIHDGDYGQGIGVYVGSFATLEPGGRTLRWLGTYHVGTEDCGTVRDRVRHRGVALFVRPGSRPRFFQQRLIATCDEPTRWTSRGSLEPAVAVD
jgi:hypothetical protein